MEQGPPSFPPSEAPLPPRKFRDGPDPSPVWLRPGGALLGLAIAAIGLTWLVDDYQRAFSTQDRPETNGDLISASDSDEEGSALPTNRGDDDSAEEHPSDDDDSAPIRPEPNP